MGHRSVELLIGRLVTDEELRRRFVAAPRQTLRALQEHGLELTTAEVDAVLASHVALWNCLAAALDPRLQKASLKQGGASKEE